MTEALLLIDFQKGFEAPQWGERNNYEAEANAARLLKHFRAQKKAIVHVRHMSVDPNSPLTGEGAHFIESVAPLTHEATFEKTVNSAFIGTNLKAHLRKKFISHLTICGLTTPHCVSTTTRMAANLGFVVTLAHDACAAFTSNSDTSWNDGLRQSAQDIHDSAINQLHCEFATARGVSDILG
jgi:nicotinamidase-related amidase